MNRVKGKRQLVRGKAACERGKGKTEGKIKRGWQPQGAKKHDERKMTKWGWRQTSPIGLGHGFKF